VKKLSKVTKIVANVLSLIRDTEDAS
jgi:hypothetical protein